jgi:PAS domain S-box-containing protein
VTENTLQHKLEALRQQLSSIQQFSREDPRQVSEWLPWVLADLRGSVTELQAIVAELPEHGEAGSDEAQPSRSKRSKDARPHGVLPFRALADAGFVMVRIMDTRAHCRWGNRAWAEFTGRSAKQLLGEGWLEDVHPEDRGRCVSICQQAYESSRLYRLEYRLLRKSGEYGWVLEIGSPRLTASGSVGGYLATAIDITEHKQTEIHLTLQYAVARVLSEAKTLEEAAAPMLQVLCESLNWDVGELWLVDKDASGPHCARVWSSPSIEGSALQEVASAREFPVSSGPAWQNRLPVWIADITADETLAREPEARSFGLHGMLRLPVSVHGEISAMLYLFCRGVRARDDALVSLTSSVGVQLSQFLERQRNIERLRESEARKAAMLEASPDAVITIDDQELVVEFNSAAETIFGYKRENAVGRKLSDLILPPRLRPQALANLAQYRAMGESGLPRKRLDALAMKSDGSEFPVEIAIASIGSEESPLITIYVCDATARKNAEHEVKLYQERVRSLMADLLLAEEQERRRLAVDLHDGLSQTIALTQIKLSGLRASMNGKLQRSLDEIEQLIDQTNRTARTISFELSPPVLHDLGLEPALQWLVENIQARYGIEIVLVNDGQPKPADEKTRVILFRSIRELLINAAKHARAHRVQLSLERKEDLINASIEDDGVGMQPDVMGAKGSGLLSIHERLSHVGGSMRIESAPGQGTKIRLCAPLTNKRPRKVSVEA